MCSPLISRGKLSYAKLLAEPAATALDIVDILWRRGKWCVYCLRRLTAWLRMPSPKIQQHGYMTARQHAEFQAYAHEHELQVASLGRLLLIRAIRLRRLPDHSLLTSERSVPKPNKITAHLSNPGLKLTFAELAREAGLTPGAAAASIFEAELSERWLDRALSLTQNES
jgi:hypothetical protein